MSEVQDPFDRSAKVLFRERPEDFLRLAMPDIEPRRIRITNPELNLAERRADEVTFVDDQLALVGGAGPTRARRPAQRVGHGRQSHDPQEAMAVGVSSERSGR